MNVGSSTRPGQRVVIEHDVPARMRDGVVLRANVYRPPDDGAYPVLLSRQPYDKNTNINPVSTRRTVLYQRSPGRPVHGDRHVVDDAVRRLFGR